MKARVLLLAFLVSLAVSVAGCGLAQNSSPTRGRYIYDDAERLPMESEIALASYLWRLDVKTGYEMVFVFPKEQLDDKGVIDRFNKLGVGKSGKDNGTAVFVMPDNTVFVGIGSGNDKVTVTVSKTEGERIFQGLGDDPVLTYLRFASTIGGTVDVAEGNQFAGDQVDWVADHFGVLLLWTAFLALLLFAVQQWDGYQPYDLALPGIVFLALFMWAGASAVSAKHAADTYSSYGIITSEKHSHSTYVVYVTESYPCGDKKTCTRTVPVTHDRYQNDVHFLTYDSKDYAYTFTTDDNKSAWDHHPGELDRLDVDIKGNSVHNPSGVDDNSGGKTIGDGTWIYAGKK